MYITTKKEQFSLAYICAVCAVAGFKIKVCNVDDDSVDFDIAASRGQIEGKYGAPHVSVQAKCTHTDDAKGDFFSFSLSIKNYDDLRDPDLHLPRIVVVVCVPEDVSAWLRETPEQLALHRTAYWASLRGEPAATSGSKSVKFLRSNRFTVASLTGILSRIAMGEAP